VTDATDHNDLLRSSAMPASLISMERDPYGDRDPTFCEDGATGARTNPETGLRAAKPGQ
jgi:hypothetical protein